MGYYHDLCGLRNWQMGGANKKDDFSNITATAIEENGILVVYICG